MDFTHNLIRIDLKTYPSHSDQWGPLERYVAICSCGAETNETYPRQMAATLHWRHITES